MNVTYIFIIYWGRNLGRQNYIHSFFCLSDSNNWLCLVNNWKVWGGWWSDGILLPVPANRGAHQMGQDLHTLCECARDPFPLLYLKNLVLHSVEICMKVIWVTHEYLQMNISTRENSKETHHYVFSTTSWRNASSGSRRSTSGRREMEAVEGCKT